MPKTFPNFNGYFTSISIGERIYAIVNINNVHIEYFIIFCYNLINYNGFDEIV